MKWLPTIDDPKVKGSCCLFSIDNNGIVSGYKFGKGKNIPVKEESGGVDQYIHGMSNIEGSMRCAIGPQIQAL